MLNGKPARDILGEIDSLKLGSSMQIFLEAEPREHRFAEILGLAGTG